MCVIHFSSSSPPNSRFCRSVAKRTSACHYRLRIPAHLQLTEYLRFNEFSVFVSVHFWFGQILDTVGGHLHSHPLDTFRKEEHNSAIRIKFCKIKKGNSFLNENFHFVDFRRFYIFWRSSVILSWKLTNEKRSALADFHFVVEPKRSLLYFVYFFIFQFIYLSVCEMLAANRMAFHFRLFSVCSIRNLVGTQRNIAYKQKEMLKRRMILAKERKNYEIKRKIRPRTKFVCSLAACYTNMCVCVCVLCVLHCGILRPSKYHTKFISKDTRSDQRYFRLVYSHFQFRSFGKYGRQLHTAHVKSPNHSF